MIAKILKLIKRIYNWAENLFCTEPPRPKKDLVAEHRKLARGLAEINNPKSRMDRLVEQTIADYTSNSQRDREREKFFKT